MLIFGETFAFCQFFPCCYNKGACTNVNQLGQASALVKIFQYIQHKITSSDWINHYVTLRYQSVGRSISPFQPGLLQQGTFCSFFFSCLLPTHFNFSIPHGCYIAVSVCKKEISRDKLHCWGKGNIAISLCPDIKTLLTYLDHKRFVWPLDFKFALSLISPWNFGWASYFSAAGWERAKIF